jgi:hypothetical protein
MVLYLCVWIVFSLHQESLKLILEDGPLPEGILSHLVTAQCLKVKPTRRVRTAQSDWSEG